MIAATVGTRLRAVLLTALLALCAPAQAQQVHDENRVKAAFLLRFGQFVQWPAEAIQQPGGSLVISVAGADAVYAALVQQLAERGPQGRPTTVRQLKSADDLAQSHILFVGSDARSRLESLVASAAKRPVLIVTDSAEAIEHGSMINFVLAERRVRFEIALDTAERAGLTVSSRLLAIAVRVHRGEAPAVNAVALGPLLPVNGSFPRSGHTFSAVNRSKWITDRVRCRAPVQDDMLAHISSSSYPHPARPSPTSRGRLESSCAFPRAS